MNKQIDRVFVVTADCNLVNVGGRCESDMTLRGIVHAFERVGFKIFTVSFPMKAYRTLRHRVSFAVPENANKKLISDLIRKIVTQFDGTVEGCGWLMTSEDKVYSSIPAHFRSDIGELVLVELAA